MNRITSAIDRMTKQIADRIASGKTTQKAVDETHKALDMDIMDHAQFQTMKSLAFTQGTLNLDEANTVYNLLGNTASVFNKQPIAVKSVLTQLWSELLKQRLSA